MKAFALIIINDIDGDITPLVSLFASKQGALEASREVFESYDTEDAPSEEQMPDIESSFNKDGSWSIEYEGTFDSRTGSIEDLEIQ